MNTFSFTRDEMREILRWAHKMNRRDWLMLLVTYRHGLRASEITGMVKDDIVDGYLVTQRKKGSLLTTQPLRDAVDPLFDERQALQQWASTVSGRLWPMQAKHFWKIVRKYCELAGVPRHKSHPHILKHSIATHARKGGASLEDIQCMLGHKNLNSTRRYLDVDEEEANHAIAAAVGW